MAKKKTGYAYTKNKPIYNHPAHYRTVKAGNIEFVVFTHAEEVDLDKRNKKIPEKEHRKIKTIKLTNNIDSSKKTEESHVTPVVYEGSRELLGAKRQNLKLVGKDVAVVNKIFKTGMRIKL